MKKIISLLMVACMMVGMLSIMPISIGAATTITIASVDDWMEKLSGKENIGEANINVTAAELDFTGKDIKPAFNFTGSFNGNGVVIKNVNMNTASDSDNECGLFYCVDSAATFENFTIKSSSFKGKEWVGAVACCINGDTTVRNVYIAEDVTVESTKGNVGGLIGGCTSKSNTTITFTNCVVAATVIGAGKYVGGLLGNGQTTTKSDVLYTKNFVITNCMMLGSVTSTDSDASGFIGYNLKNFENAYYGTITATNCVYAGRGFVSYPFGKAGSFTATNCYTTAVNTEDNAIYNSGDVRVTTADQNTGVTVVDAASLIGENASVTLDGFTKRANDIMLPDSLAANAPALFSKTYSVTWKNGDATLATETYNYGATPSYKGETPTKADDNVFTYEFKGWTPALAVVNGDTTYEAEFNRTAKNTGDTSNVWDEWDGTANDAYNAEGEGTSESPYVIRTAEQWANLANASVTGIPDGLYFVLEANLDFKNINTETSKLVPISPDGKKLLIYFDGKGHTIKGVNMEGTHDGTALFGDIWGDKDLTKNMVSSIKNFVVAESTFKRENGWISAVVGETSGPVIIENVYVDKTVIIETGAKGKAGGIVGGCYYSSGGAAEYTVTINDCVFAGRIISAGEGNGGIVGYVNTKLDGSNDEVIHIAINRCLVTGQVQHDQAYSNGFVGFAGKADYQSGSGVKPTVKITDSILASGAKGEYYKDYPFCESSSVTLTNCYTVSAGENGAMYKSGENVGTTGATVLTAGRDAITGTDAQTTIDGWVKRDGDVMIPAGVVDFAPTFISDVTVKWEVNGVIVSEETYAMGEMPTYKGETPSKPDEGIYAYVFSGWSPEISVAVGDVTYVAEFYSTRKNVVVEEDETDETEAPETTAAPETTEAAEEEKGGCGSMIGGGAVALVAVLGSAVAFGKKKED